MFELAGIAIGVYIISLCVMGFMNGLQGGICFVALSIVFVLLDFRQRRRS